MHENFTRVKTSQLYHGHLERLVSLSFFVQLCVVYFIFLVQLLLSHKQEGDIGPSRTSGLAPPYFCGGSVLFEFLFFSFPFVFVLLLVFGVQIVLLYKYLFLLGY